MKLALPLLLSAATISSISIPSPTTQLESSLPDKRFKKDLTFGGPFLPVDPTFINILHFMSTVAGTDFDELVEPHTYTAPVYRQVQISTSAWTEARFLLWGIYSAAIYMVRFSRFHDVLIKLYWDKSPVGEINLMASGTTGNDARGFIDDGGELSPVDTGRNTTQILTERLKTPSVQNTTGRGTTNTTSAVDSINIWYPALSIPSTSPTPFLNAPLSTRMSINVERVIGAVTLKRHDVFLTFYTAILHLAQVPAADAMRSFNSKSPTADLRVHMFETGLGCLVGTYHHIHYLSDVNMKLQC